jgi:hypothetical protein
MRAYVVIVLVAVLTLFPTSALNAKDWREPMANQISVWVNSLVRSDASTIVEALNNHAIQFHEWDSNSALAPSKLVIGFGPATPLADIKAVARALPYAYITFVPGESYVQRVVFVGMESYDEKSIISIREVSDAINSARNMESLIRVVPWTNNPNG